MARQEEPREDLMREATALRERAELRLPGCEDSLIIGFRAGGAGCVYLGEDVSWQFNPQGELRRGFSSGRLLKAEAGRLVWLTRERSAREVALVRHECSDQETASLLADCQQLLDRLKTALATGSFQLVRQVPEQGDLVACIGQWLRGLPDPLVIAASPRAGG